jgi:hypothetical protein
MLRLISILLFSFFLTYCQTSTAQETKRAPEAQRYSIGLKFGPSVTFPSYPDKELRDLFSSKPKFGYGGMGFISFPLSKTRYSYFAEAGYAVRGRKYSTETGGLNNQTFQFAELSMGLRRSFDLKLKKNVPTKWFINVGPNVQYWLSGKGKFGQAKYKMVFDPAPENSELFTNYLSGVNRWLFGVDFGIGADAPITKKQFIRIELRATLGQTYLGKKTNSTTYANLSWIDSLKTNLKTISLTASYSFDFDTRARKFGKSTKDKMIRRRK